MSDTTPLSAHVQGTGDLAYPDQDPAELRAKAVRDAVEKVRVAIRRYSLLYSRYASRQADYTRVCDARYSLDRAVNYAQHVMLDALESAEVPVVHDTEAP